MSTRNTARTGDWSLGRPTRQDIVAGFVTGLFSIPEGMAYASIPRSLPLPVLPDLSVAPRLLVGALAVALVALAQAAGISAAVPNPDGSRISTSGDFLAQGLANVGGGFFQALPVGGSLSRTGVSVGGGARSRWSGMFAGLWLAVLVLAFGPVAELIPMPVIGGLLLIIGGELLAARIVDIRLVVRTAVLPTVAMVVTFLATTQFPLQDAILLGASLSLLLYCVDASRVGRLVAMVPSDPEHPTRWRIAGVPDEAPSNAITVLQYLGTGLFAEVSRMDELWPRTDATRNAVIILGVRTLPDIPSSTLLRALARRSTRLRDQGVRLILVGIDPQIMAVFEGSGTLAVLGKDNVYPETDEVFGSLDRAMADARAWLANRYAPTT